MSAPLSGGYVKNRRVSLPNLSPLPCPSLHVLSFFFFDSGKIAFTRFLLNANFLYLGKQVLILDRDFKKKDASVYEYLLLLLDVNYRKEEKRRC